MKKGFEDLFLGWIMCNWYGKESAGGQRGRGRREQNKLGFICHVDDATWIRWNWKNKWLLTGKGICGIRRSPEGHVKGICTRRKSVGWNWRRGEGTENVDLCNSLMCFFIFVCHTHCKPSFFLPHWMQIIKRWLRGGRDSLTIWGGNCEWSDQP